MGYVMVPVPEEHVEEVMQTILRVAAQARTKPWDAEAIGDWFRRSDEVTKAVLSVVARGSLKQGKVADARVAEAVELSIREILGLIRELNEAVERESRPSIVFHRVEAETLPNGRVTEQRVIWSNSDVASWIRAAEQEELASTPHHLMGNDG